MYVVQASLQATVPCTAIYVALRSEQPDPNMASGAENRF